jgi:hypothetical protein
VDGLFERTRFDRGTALRGIVPRRFDDLWSAVSAQLERSRGLVDRVYRLEPALGEEGASEPEVVAFTRDRYREAAGFVASLYWTAWQDSAGLELPVWLDRREY